MTLLRWQVIGDVRAAADLGPEDLAVVGADGMLLAGPRAEALEPVAAVYARLRCRMDFCNVIHARLQQAGPNFTANLPSANALVPNIHSFLFALQYSAFCDCCRDITLQCTV